MAWNDKFEIEDPEAIKQIKSYSEDTQAAQFAMMDMARKQQTCGRLLWALIKELMGEAYDEKRHYKLEFKDGNVSVIDRGPVPANDYD